MYAIYGNIYHQYTPNVSIYTIHGSYGYYHDISTTWCPSSKSLSWRFSDMSIAVAFVLEI